jgi:N6-L-threonylcarbamoyladenine synthase
VLEKHNNKSQLHFHSKITSDNRATQGIHPLVALESHQKNLATLVHTAFESFPVQGSAIAHLGNTLLVDRGKGAVLRKKPDFITVTRGPGMRANLNTGLETAKGLAVAWQIPLLGVNHMQAHALTPRLVSSLGVDDDSKILDPAFPFLSLLVSGGHTMLVHTRELCDHKILAKTSDIAVGDVLDKCAREILPNSIIENGGTVMYGRLLEEFAFPSDSPDYDYNAPATKEERIEAKDVGYGWSITPPLSRTQSGSKVDRMEYSFSGLGSKVERVMASNPTMSEQERRILAREAMRIAFEHLASRVLIALRGQGMEHVTTVVVSGGVASNQYLKHIIRAMLDKQGYGKLELVFPPPSLCTDNAAMIAWTGMEMWEAGWRSDLDILALKKWALDPHAEDGGILGAEGWISIK